MNVIWRNKWCSHNGGKLAIVGVALSPAVITPSVILVGNF